MGRNSKYYDAVERAKKKRQISSSHEKYNNSSTRVTTPKNSKNELRDLRRWSKYYINEDQFTDYSPYGRNKNGTPFDKNGRPIGGGSFDQTGFDPTGKSDLRNYNDTVISKDQWNHLGRAFNKYFVKERKDKDNRNEIHTSNSRDNFKSRYYDNFLRTQRSNKKEYNKALENYEKILKELKDEYKNKRQALLDQKEESLRQNYVENELRNQSDSQRFASMGIAEGDEHMGNQRNNTSYNLKRSKTIKSFDEKLKDLEEKNQKAQAYANDHFKKQNEKLQKSEMDALLKSPTYKKALSLYSQGKSRKQIERALKQDYVDNNIIELLMEQLNL